MVGREQGSDLPSIFVDLRLSHNGHMTNDDCPCLCTVEIRFFLFTESTSAYPISSQHPVPTFFLNYPTMASSSKPTVSQVEANSLADDWEARVRRFIDNDDEAGFLKDQPVLFKKLVSLEVSY